MQKLYHKEVFLPGELIERVSGKYNLRFGKHAKEACQTDRYGFIYPPLKVFVNKDNILEIQTTNNIIDKIVIREPYQSSLDLTLVFIPEFGAGFVKTLWLNDKNDKHQSLDASPYQKS